MSSTVAVGETGVAPPTPPTQRVASVDVLRGLIMVIMAVDHVREFFSASTINPTDPQQTTLGLFLTRWITHICAPTFVFLAGTAIYLQMRRKSQPQLARFLVSRGLWLCLLEVTVMHVVQVFNWHWDAQVLNILWLIGICMMMMAPLIYLKPAVVGVIGAVVIALHNLLDPVKVASFGSFGWVWHLLHVPGFLTDDPTHLPTLVAYSLIPWPGVMAIGFAFGVLLDRDSAARQRWLVRAGTAMIAAFLVLRLTNIYGDLRPWSHQTTVMRTAFSILNVNKYPPSLDFLLATLGLSALLMAAIEFAGRLSRFTILRGVLNIYGRVPFFYYVLHFFLAHLLALFTAMAVGANWHWYVTDFPNGGVFAGKAPGFGFGLPMVWVFWLVVVALSYPLCRWYARVKQSRRHPLLSYL